ncbi:hypothetical protein ABN238_19180 [Providencia rettgeri]|uniref:hypothetical protein n=1 Tax=Providencia rettgeri TaxID=587 RepID=UPI0032DB8F8F
MVNNFLNTQGFEKNILLDTRYLKNIDYIQVEEAILSIVSSIERNIDYILESNAKDLLFYIKNSVCRSIISNIRLDEFMLKKTLDKVTNMARSNSSDGIIISQWCEQEKINKKKVNTNIGEIELIYENRLFIIIECLAFYFKNRGFIIIQNNGFANLTIQSILLSIQDGLFECKLPKNIVGLV